ncbi:MAG: TonB-dependent receptor, partial [Acidobacteriota bacterium]
MALTNDATGLKRQATTDDTGLYRILDLPQGTYTIEVSASGFRSLRKTNVIVVIGQVNAQDLQLVVGAPTQEVTVQGSVAVLQTQKADVHTEITSHAITNLPLNVYRNFQAVTLLTPGVFSVSAIADSYPNGLASGPERSMSIYSNGLPSRINNTRIDGATSLNAWLPDHVLIIPPQETIQEVNVQTATYGVEKGLTAGAATDVVTKSGTNDLHGSLYAFHTNDALVARNFYDFNPKKAKRVHNNDGAALGGPIKKNKLFFFANWDGYWERKNSAGTGLIPPQSYRDGDFTSALELPLFDNTGKAISVCTTEGGTTQLRQGMVFDPTTGNQTNGTGRCVFSSNGRLNVIPPSRIVKGARNFWPLLSQPKIADPITVNTAFNDFYTTNTRFTRQIGTGKVDWNRNDRHTVWGKWTLQEANVSVPMQYGKAGGSSGYSGFMRTQTGTVGHTWTLSPSLVLTGHVGYSKQRTDAFAANHGEPLGQTVLGVPGTNEPLGNVLYTGLPSIQIGGWATLGNGDASTPYTRRDLGLTISQNLAWLRGRHEIRLGFDSSRNHINHFQPEQCCMRGALTFSQGNTSINVPADPANPANGQFLQLYTSSSPSAATYAGRGHSAYLQNSIAAFNLGLMSRVDKSFQFIDFTAGSFPFALYIGDRWKATPKFTIDLGLRWEYFPMITRDTEAKFELYDPDTNTQSFGGIAGNPTHLGITTSKKLFDPRIGLAYQLNDRTVVRAGYGIANDSMPLERPLRGFYPMVIAASGFHPSTFVSGFLPYTSFDKGIPLLRGPDISSGKVTPPPDVTVGTIAPGEFKRGYVQSWNFFIERRLPGEMLLNAGYVGNHFVHEFNGQDINAAPLGGGSASQPLARFGRYLATSQFQGYLNSHYHSLQVSLNRRTARGLFLQGS